MAIPAALGSLESVTALVVAHGAAGGEVPSSWWLAAFGLLVYAAGGLVLRHRVSIRVVLPALLAAQVIGHGWLVALSPGVHPGHEHATSAFLGLTPGMVAAHLAAAAVTGLMWVLRRRAVEVLLHWTEPGVVPLPRPRALHPGSPRPARTGRAHRALAPTRGPPRRSLAIA